MYREYLSYIKSYTIWGRREISPTQLRRGALIELYGAQNTKLSLYTLKGNFQYLSLKFFN